MELGSSSISSRETVRELGSSSNSSRSEAVRDSETESSSSSEDERDADASSGTDRTSRQRRKTIRLNSDKVTCFIVLF